MGMEYFGDKLRALRMKKNLTQNDLAARLGIVGASVSSYEKNKQYPSVEVLIQLCQTFDVSADYLLGLSDTPNPENKVASIDNVDTDALALAAEHDGIKNYHENLANVLAKQGIKI